MAQKFTAIFQPADRKRHREQEWLEEIFGPFLEERIIDSDHKVVCDNAIVFDGFIDAVDPGYYRQFKGRNAFLVQMLDETYAGSYHLYQNFKGVYRNHWSSVFNPAYVRALPYGYIVGMNPTLKIPPAHQRPLVWSFAGATRRGSRADMAAALKRVEPHYFFSSNPMRGYVTKPCEAEYGVSGHRYQRMLLDSIFSPSPMGNVNLECYRTYEALECGSIPIVERRLGLDYYRELLGPHPMPTVRSWPEARVVIRGLLQDYARLDALQAECMAWWTSKKAGLRAEVGVFLEQRSADATVGDRPMFKPRANSRFWRYGELLRHHDLRAAWRRATLQASRWAERSQPPSAEAPSQPGKSSESAARGRQGRPS